MLCLVLVFICVYLSCGHSGCNDVDSQLLSTTCDMIQHHSTRSCFTHRVKAVVWSYYFPVSNHNASPMVSTRGLADVIRLQPGLCAVIPDMGMCSSPFPDKIPRVKSPVGNEQVHYHPAMLFFNRHFKCVCILDIHR